MMQAAVLAKFGKEDARDAYLTLRKRFQVLPLFGTFDLLIAVEAETYPELSQTIMSINRMKGIGATNSMMVVPHEVLVESLERE